MSQIFISYSRKNERTAKNLEIYLKKAGLLVWRDNEEIRGGDDWMDKIEEALMACQVLVVIWSRHAKSSKYLNMEIKAAERSNSIRIIPCVIEDEQLLPLFLKQLQYRSIKKGQIEFPEALQDVADALDKEVQLPAFSWTEKMLLIARKPASLLTILVFLVIAIYFSANPSYQPPEAEASLTSSTNSLEQVENDSLIEDTLAHSEHYDFNISSVPGSQISVTSPLDATFSGSGVISLKINQVVALQITAPCHESSYPSFVTTLSERNQYFSLEKIPAQILLKAHLEGGDPERNMEITIMNSQRDTLDNIPRKTGQPFSLMPGNYIVSLSKDRSSQLRAYVDPFLMTVADNCDLQEISIPNDEIDNYVEYEYK